METRTIIFILALLSVIGGIWCLTLSIQTFKITKIKEGNMKQKKSIDLKTVFMTTTAILAVFLLAMYFGLSLIIDNQKATIEKQSKKLEECSFEIKRLKLVEQDYETDKEYIYECFKQIEMKAERSGK